MASPFQIKVCGVTNAKNANDVVAEGADAIGLNFYRASKRHVSVDEACTIADAVRSRAHVVGVFVEGTPEEMVSIAERVGLDLIQLHGNQSIEFAQQLLDASGRRPLLPVFAATRETSTAITGWFDAVGRHCVGVLIDAQVAGEYGGTGHQADWSLVRGLRNEVSEKVPVVLAGGLRPDNVEEAILRTGVDSVDVASGVESSPGIKSLEDVRAFVARARKAWSGG